MIGDGGVVDARTVGNDDAPAARRAHIDVLATRPEDTDELETRHRFHEIGAEPDGAAGQHRPDRPEAAFGAQPF